MNRTMLFLLPLLALACTNEASVDIEAAQTGIYEAHTVVLQDDCTWDGFVADYGSEPRQLDLFVDSQEEIINLPFVEEHGGTQRFDIFAGENFQLHLDFNLPCGSQTQHFDVLELSRDKAVVHRERQWRVEEECEAEVTTQPDATCSTFIEQVMFLETPCESPCEIRLMPGEEPTCECSEDTESDSTPG